MKFRIKLFIQAFVISCLSMSSAFGQCYTCGTTAPNTYSTAFGSSSNASANHSIAIGYSSNASAMYSLSLGIFSTASNNSATAIGPYSIASGSQSFALGQGAQAIADQSYAFGKYVKSSATGAMVIGCGSSSQILTNNIYNSLMVGFNGTPTLFVGPSYPYGPVNNVGINTISPLQSLHVIGSILMTGASSSFLIADDIPQNGLEGDWGLNYYNRGLNFYRPLADGHRNYYLFIGDYGNVGINNGQPTTKLDINGNLRVSSLAATNGGTMMVVADVRGVLSSVEMPVGDNLGNHVATQNINLNGYFLSGDGADNGIYVDKTGKVGVGTNVPLAQMDVFSDNGNNFYLRTTGGNKATTWVSNDVNSYGIAVDGNGMGYLCEKKENPEAILYFKDGKVGIGAPPASSHKLYVTGGITTEEVKVRVQSQWTDYVFENHYKLMPLNELEKFISQNKHLPDVPSAEVVKKDGINLGEMNALLLKKVEELTLYILNQEKKIEALQKAVDQSKKQ